MVLALILYIIPLIYGFIKDGLGKGQSWGKRAMGLMVVHIPTNTPCTKGKSFVRWLISALLSGIPYVCYLTVWIEFILVLATKDGRRLADKVAKTQVIEAKLYQKQESQASPRKKRSPAVWIVAGVLLLVTVVGLLFVFVDGSLWKHREGFTVESGSIGEPSADGVSGFITYTGDYYRVRSMGGTWWMTENADSYVSSGCTHSSIDRDSYGRLYSWDCAEEACPPGWSLPTDEDFEALGNWLDVHGGWYAWNSDYSLAGFGFDGSYYGGQGSYGSWWSSSSSDRIWYVNSGSTSGSFSTGNSSNSFSVRCRKYQ
jgi:uncharacterized protein (TIGR02145 family)